MQCPNIRIDSISLPLYCYRCLSNALHQILSWMWACSGSLTIKLDTEWSGLLCYHELGLREVSLKYLTTYMNVVTYHWYTAHKAMCLAHSMAMYASHKECSMQHRPPNTQHLVKYDAGSVITHMHDFIIAAATLYIHYAGPEEVGHDDMQCHICWLSDILPIDCTCDDTFCWAAVASQYQYAAE